jgi:hypothetical protein
VHFGNFWKNQTSGGPLAATQRCFNAIHLAAASPCRCLACMPHCLKISPPPNLIFLLLVASSHFSSPPACQAGRAKPPLLLVQLALLCCHYHFALLLRCLLAAALLLAVLLACCCATTCLTPVLLLCYLLAAAAGEPEPPLPFQATVVGSQGRAPTPAEQRPLHRPSPPHSSSSRASPLPSSSELEHYSATSFLPWSSTVPLSSLSYTPATSPEVVAVTTHELPTSANL